ncbi:MAG TPA: LysM peptidoglycan-binding domain-containing protein, partial [Anseongella sp.]|nr:LysM peptidoglycan-binding domain-containing protein [Anseongella sp.]
MYRFAKPVAGEIPDGDVPPEQENPYRAVGKTVALAMRWQDIFGNLTGFTATGDPVVLPPQKVGYTDPVIGLSMYPSVAASYIIALTAEETPALYITLAFNPSPYVPVKAGDEAWRQRVSSDREAYRQIYYQLQQQDMKVSVTNTLAGDALPGRGVDTVKPVLIDLVLTLFQYLGLLETTEQIYTFYTAPSSGATLDEVAAAYDTTPEQIRRINPDIPADGILQPGTTVIISAVDIPEDALLTTPLSDDNPESLFALVTKMTLTRDPELVADDFKDEPSVTGATSVLGPNLRKEGATGSTAAITIQEFAQKLEAAFPGLKTASGTPQAGVQDDSAVELWVVRFSDTETGIRFTITNSGDPFYFALKPLSTHLISREDVKIYPYVTGTPIMDMPSVGSAFNGVDMEQLAQTCLAAIDIFLGADYAIPAWQVEQALGSQADDNT